MVKKRPCRICRRWFQPHPRAGDRQRVCGEAGCQRERHRRACAGWRAKEVEGIRRHRLRQRLREEEGGVGVGASGRVRWDAVRDAVGLEVAETMEVVTGEMESWVRDAVSA